MRLTIIIASALALVSSDVSARDGGRDGRGGRGDNAELDHGHGDRGRGGRGDHGHKGDRDVPAPSTPNAPAAAPQTNADGPDTRALRSDDACAWPFWQRTWACKP